MKDKLPFIIWPGLLLVAFGCHLLLVGQGWSLYPAFLICYFSLTGVILALEFILPRCKSWIESDGQITNDILYSITTVGVVNTLFGRGFDALLVVLLGMVASVHPANWQLWPEQIPMFIQCCLALMIVELVRYWGHRLSHTIKFFWNFHTIHHSPVRLSVINTGRIHPGELLPLIFSIVAIVVLGIPKEVVIWQAAFTSYVAVLAHANIKIQPGILDYVFNTPIIHRWHHSNRVHECNHNYGHTFCIYDRLFGTYHNPEDRIPRQLGVPGQVPAGFTAQLIYPFTNRCGQRIIKAPTGQ